MNSNLNKLVVSNILLGIAVILLGIVSMVHSFEINHLNHVITKQAELNESQGKFNETVTGSLTKSPQLKEEL